MVQEVYDIFISYSRANLEQVKKVKAELEQVAGVTCWMDLDGIESGEQFEKVIISAINRSQSVLFVLTEESMNSEWALDELDFAKKKGKRLVIVTLDDVNMSDLFYFRYHKYDRICWNNSQERKKLVRDIIKWKGESKNPKTDRDEKQNQENDSATSRPAMEETGNQYGEIEEDYTDSGNSENERSVIKSHAKRTNRFYSRLIIGALGALVSIGAVLVIVKVCSGNPRQFHLGSEIQRDSLSALGDMLGNPDNGPVISSDFVLVPGGRLEYESYLRPQRADVDSFYISKYELTQGEYSRIVGGLNDENTSWRLQTYSVDSEFITIKGDSIPVQGKYSDFVDYCNRRSIQEGYDGFYVKQGDSITINPHGNGYRLVTPYEWIFAAFGGNLDKKEKYLGGNSLSEVAWHLGNSESKPHPVGQKKPNAIGLYDIQGNARELLQGDEKHLVYCSMLGGYNVSNWNYSQAFDPTYIWDADDEYSKDQSFGVRIALITKDLKNNNLSFSLPE